MFEVLLPQKKEHMTVFLQAEQKSVSGINRNMEETNAQKPQYWETPLIPLSLFSPVVAFHIKLEQAMLLRATVQSIHAR